MSRFSAIGIGQSDNDGGGDPLRSAIRKVNQNFGQADTDLTAVESTANAAQIVSALSLDTVNGLTPTLDTIVWASTIDYDLDGARYQRTTIAGDTTVGIVEPIPFVSGFAKGITVVLESDGASDHNLTFDPAILWYGLGPPGILPVGSSILISFTAFGPSVSDIKAIAIFQS